MRPYLSALGLLTFLGCLTIGAGCAGQTPFQRDNLVRKHPEWASRSLEVVQKGEIQRGMSKDQVLASWGKPLRIIPAEQYPQPEKWEYRKHVLFFRDGVLTDWSG